MKNQKESSNKVESNNSKKKKADKILDALKREVSEMPNVEDKINHLFQKYSELSQNFKQIKSASVSNEKQIAIMQGEKDNLTKEYSKVLLQRDNLENLCRELHKQKVKIQEDSLNRARLEDEKRKEISTLFKTKISEIESQMASYQEHNDKLRSENQDLAVKLTKFLEQYEVKEQHNSKMLQTKDLEFQLAEAKLKQSQTYFEEFSTKFKQEKDQSDKQMDDLKSKIKMHEQIENKLKEQIEFYRSKYDDFQKTLTESNQVFITYKKEMEKMTSNLKRLEKENAQLKQKWENSNYSTLMLAAEKTQSEEQISRMKAKVEKLESLCRALQTERLELRRQLDEKKISELDINEPSLLETPVEQQQEILAAIPSE